MGGFWNHLALLLSRKERTCRIPVAERFAHFRAIGAANDAFLRDLAGLQERLEASTILGLGMVAAATEALSINVGSMVKSLVAMSGGRYETLEQRFQELAREARHELLRTDPIESGPFLVWPGDAEALQPYTVGPKTARLAQVSLNAGLKVPAFFSVSIHGYRHFMEGSGIRELINRMLSSLDLRDAGAMRKFSEVVIDAFARAVLPQALEKELLAAYRKLVASSPGIHGVAVRSSAVVEDAESSFAGQFESVLNVNESGLAEAYKQVVASKYRLEALRYAVARRFVDEDIAMPVLVMAMVPPSASGVAYSRCPERPESVMITAVRGLAQAVVDGRIIPDTVLVAGKDQMRVEEVLLGKRDFSLQCAAGGGLAELSDTAAGPALHEEPACQVAQVARALDRHFGSAQDVEWVLDDTGSVSVVQTRPLHLSFSQTGKGPTAQVEGYRVLVRGVRASGGVASGNVFQLMDTQDTDAVPEGAILCVPNTSPRLAGIIGSVRGVVAVLGSPTGHMATVAREFDVPCLVGAENAFSALPQGKLVTLDAYAGIVYEGEVRELLDSGRSTAAPREERDDTSGRMQRLLQRVAPLTLDEPGASTFDPGHCRTFHDIARYVHQKSMSEMFELEDLSRTERRAARRLLWRAPMEVLILDLGGGLSADSEQSVPINKVTSTPLLALIEGMMDPRLRWAGPVGFDLKGFMSVVVRSAADDQRYGEPVYCLCAHDYLHFASRLAYHFATVDAICGQLVNENYARFLFFGGAAVAARREWRAHFLATVLSFNGFAVNQVGDRVDAILAKRNVDQIEEALVMLGRLMVAARHLDMVIESRAAADALAQAFLSGDYGFELVGKSN